VGRSSRRGAELDVEEPVWRIRGATQKSLLARYCKALRAASEQPRDASTKALASVRAEVLHALEAPVSALEAVRLDAALVNEPAYRVLWDLPAIDAGSKAVVAIASVDRAPAVMPGLFFLTDAVGDAALTSRAIKEAPARKQLLARFATQLSLRQLPTDGDMTLHDGAMKGGLAAARLVADLVPAARSAVLRHAEGW
jgi:hypothetical protein